MKSYKLVHQLLTLVEQLETEHPGEEISLQDFAGFLVTSLNTPDSTGESSEVRFGKQEDKALDIAFQVDNNIGRLFVFMSRYAKSYIKKALEGTPLQSGEDFTCLAILLTHDHISKAELISNNLQEKASGTEVIRRLIKAGLVRQFDDPTDKRGKRITITQAGRELLYRIFEHTNHVGKVITGTLTFPEKLTLQYLLQKLENFHYYHHEHKTIQNKNDLQTVAEELENAAR